MDNLFTLLGTSLHEAINSTFKKPMVWLALSLIAAVIYFTDLIVLNDTFFPFFSLPQLAGMVLIVVSVLLMIIAGGVYIKSFRNEELTFTPFGKTCKEGFFAVLIFLFYELIPFLLSIFVVWGVNVWSEMLLGPYDTLIYCIGIVTNALIIFSLFIMADMILQPALVKFARNGKLGEAFGISSLCDMYAAITWKRGILAYIMVSLTAVAIYFSVIGIGYLFTLIPGWGIFVGIMVSSLLTPYIFVFVGKFSKKLFEGVN